MKQISEVGEKAVHVAFKYLSRKPASCSVDISFKDDVTVLLLLGGSFMCVTHSSVSSE
jgi:hypothetical protein